MDWDWRISAENLTYIAEGLGLVLCLFFVLRFRLSFRDLGLSLSHLKQGWKLLLIYLVCVVGGLIALRYILLAMPSGNFFGSGSSQSPTNGSQPSSI